MCGRVRPEGSWNERDRGVTYRLHWNDRWRPSLCTLAAPTVSESDDSHENPVSWHKPTDSTEKPDTTAKRHSAVLTYASYVNRLSRLLNEFKTFPRYWLVQISRRLPYWNLIPSATDNALAKDRRSCEILLDASSLQFLFTGRANGGDWTRLAGKTKGKQIHGQTRWKNARRDCSVRVWVRWDSIPLIIGYVNYRSIINWKNTFIIRSIVATP